MAKSYHGKTDYNPFFQQIQDIIEEKNKRKMMKYIEERVKHCRDCGQKTKHFRNSSKPNYLLHLILIILTAGVWIIPFTIILIFSIDIIREKFTCNKCGLKNWSKFDIWLRRVLIFLGGVLGFLFIVGVIFGGK